MNPFTFRTPASSANLGPGFDCLALALDLFNTIQVELAESGEEISIMGEGEGELPRDRSNLLLRAMESVFEEFGERPPGYRLSVTNDIPLRSGLGSSSAAVIAGVIAGCYLLKKACSSDQLLQIASHMEPHADNLAASLLGGFVAVGQQGDRVVAQSIPIHPMQVAVITPEIELHTLAMREALPSAVPHEDATFTVSRAILTVEALRNGDFELLRWAMLDKLHQPFRQKFIPGYEEVRTAAEKAGAAAVALSGAGPSLIAFAPAMHEEIALAMQSAFHSTGVRSKWYILQVTDEGAIKSAHW